MKRSPFSPSPRNALVGTSVLLLLLTVTPTRWSGWTSWFGGVAAFLVAPVEAPLNWLVGSLKHPNEAVHSRDPEIAALERQLQEWKDEYLRVRKEKDDLQRQLVAIQRGLVLNPNQPFKSLAAPVIGYHADGSVQMLRIRAGSRNSITENSVVVFDGVNLVGRIPRNGVGDRVSRVLPITDRSTAAIGIVVYPSELQVELPPDPAAYSVAGQLTPDGEGLLSGPVEAPRLRAGEQPIRLAVGMLARLSDPRWPRSAQMLVVGRIERLDVQPNGREIITVRPMFELPLAEVIVRVSSEDDADGSGAAGPLQKGGRP